MVLIWLYYGFISFQSELTNFWSFAQNRTANFEIKF